MHLSFHSVLNEVSDYKLRTVWTLNWDTRGYIHSLVGMDVICTPKIPDSIPSPPSKRISGGRGWMKPCRAWWNPGELRRKPESWTIHSKLSVGTSQTHSDVALIISIPPSWLNHQSQVVSQPTRRACWTTGRLVDCSWQSLSPKPRWPDMKCTASLLLKIALFAKFH